MSDTSNNKRFGSAEEIQASDRKSKCSCSNAMFCLGHVVLKRVALGTRMECRSHTCQACVIAT